MAVTYAPFEIRDTLRFSEVNLDPWTETFSVGYYMNHLASYPECFLKAQDRTGNIVGYVMGRVEDNHCRGHICALSVCHSYRGAGIGRKMMQYLEDVFEEKECSFMSLFVRSSNKDAISFYEKLGFTLYRICVDYYDTPYTEDAYDMRKSLSRDKEKVLSTPSCGNEF